MKMPKSGAGKQVQGGAGNAEQVQDNSMATTSTPRVSSVGDTSMQSPLSANGSLTKSGVQTRQKRVLPSRSRRGGPGVGSCDIDIMILETLKRRLESEPLIPANTKFLLTTNSSLVPSTSNSDPFQAEINSHAYTRYFDRPEVQKAYKEQQIIQTPKFTQLDEDANVGGRFRPRGAEDESADTSDAVYEKRHRKYETFEKRQRLREKEKLKHEQYKLKERIDQLRAMDTSAFLALPAAEFPVTSDDPSAAGVEEDPEFGDMSGANLHGTAAYIEGERRRKQMLAIASNLEERYRTLLPSDRKFLEKKTPRPDSASMSVEPDLARKTVTAEVSEEEEVDQLIESDVELAKESLPQPHHNDDGESEVDPEERDRERSKGLKLKIKFPSQLKNALAKHSTSSKKQTTLSPFLAKSIIREGQKEDGHVPKIPATTSIFTASAGPLRVRAADGKFLAKHKRLSLDSASAKGSPRKRIRTDTSTGDTGESISTGWRQGPNGLSPTKGHVSYAGAAGRSEQTTCMLLVSALRNSAAPNVRKTQRNVLAFGTRVPPEIEEVRDFEVPDWILSSSWSRSHDGWRDESEQADGYSQASGSYAGTTMLYNGVKHESESADSSTGGPPEDDEGSVQIAYLE